MYKPFRAALQAIRQELDRAGDRHPDVFYEELMMVMPRKGKNRFWQEFVERQRPGGRGVARMVRAQ